ncbi:MAG: enoyl-CoA hydratase/isomerase family protein [Candidatus Thorarchaeota archaeon]|nr:MAG: enoyl-CoA hydratase/isomerase family protein [Candidatus Thorarchaeota archaeon]
MMSEEVVLLDMSNGIATITINRPDKYNALNSEVVTKIREFMQKAEEDEAIRVVVLTGVGEKAFASGADINEFKGRDSKSVRPRVERGQELCTYMESMSKPTIAAINGYALGGGCEFAMACDIRYASSNARLGQPEILLGIIPGYGGTVRLPRHVGLGRAKEMVFTGDQISAEEAHRIGLVNRVFETVDDLRAGVDELAAKLVKKPGVAIKLAKQSLNGAWSMSLEDNLVFEIDAFCETFDTEDKDIGVEAFLSKGKPEFKHK